MTKGKYRAARAANNARRRQIQPRHEDGDTNADAVADADADGAAIPQF